MTLKWLTVRSTGSSGFHGARDVDEHAVAEIDRIVQTEHQRRRAVLARVVFEHALASETRLRVLAARSRRIAFAASLATRPARTDTRSLSKTRRCGNARNRRATCAGTIVLVAHVRAELSVEPNLRPARNSTFGQSGSAPRSPDREDPRQTAVAPASSSARLTDGDENLRRPSRGDERLRQTIARTTRCTSDGPILPVAPSTSTSPSRRRQNAMSDSLGDDKRSSRSASVVSR